jgi:hypothetical protein
MAINQGNQNRLKHGAGAGEVALTKGEDFAGLAAQQEQAVREEAETAGIPSIVRRGATRLQTVADLYYAAILAATDIDKLDALVKRYGWIQNSALRAWAQVQAVEGKREAVDVSTVLRSLEGGEDVENT